MNKLFLVLITIILCLNNCLAQTVSNYKCLYSFDMVKDTVTNNQFRNEIYIVQIGDGVTRGFTYNKFYVDSLETNDPDKLRKMRGEFLNQSLASMKASGSRSMNDSPLLAGAFESYIYKNYNDDKIVVFEDISGQEFVYEDELRPQEWAISDETMSVLGYPSQKATCTFRGREFEAWFTTEIPISEGPWKFYGLPGLITKIHDTQHHYSFELVGFQKVEEEIEVKSDKNARKISRVKFLKESCSGELAEKINKSNAMMIGFSTSGSKKAVRTYDNIELDYR